MEYQKTQFNKVVRGAKRATYNEDVIHAILDDGIVCYVGYVFKGQAITIPMAYGRKGNKVLLHGSMKNRLLLSLLDAGKASITIMHLDALVLARSGFHHSVNYRSASLFGTVKEIKDYNEKEVALKCLLDHMMKGRWEHLRPMSEKDKKSTLVVAFTIEQASAKIRDVGVEDEKEDYELPIWAGLMPLRQVARLPESDPVLSETMNVPEHVMDYYKKHQ